MPWTTPSLRDVRAMTRDAIAATMATVIVPKQRILAALNAAATLGNSMLRVLSDATSGLAHLVLRYIDWLAKQLMPDTAETEWLDRHGQIWLTNSDGTLGRKAAEFATGTVTVTGTQGTVVPAAAQLSTTDISFETLTQVSISASGSSVPVRALDPGAIGNLVVGDVLQFEVVVDGIDNTAIANNDFHGGADTETDDDLRARVLERIQQPPMGGSQEDYVRWALSFGGVTRAWAYPLELGPGTVVIRFMMDILRADNYGIPTAEDVLAVAQWIDKVRPVAVKDIFVVAPIPYPINFTLRSVVPDTTAIRAGIESSVRHMFLTQAIPGETLHRSSLDEALSQVVGLNTYELTFTSTPMPDNGHLPILGSIIYAP
jgi:uncharacterized phage protein gp47/JayE